MASAREPLFRKEAMRFRADRLQGTVSISVPIAWQAIGFLLLATLAAAICFLSLGSYARVEMAAGVIVLDRGVASIMPSRAGVVRSIAVRETQAVRAGQPLLLVRSEEAMLGGDTAPDRIRHALAQQDAHLAQQNVMAQAAARADQARLRETVSGATDELAGLATQIDDQRHLIATAQADFDNARRIAASGFVSKRDIDLREATLLSRRQQLAQLQQLQSAKRTDIAEARRSITQADAATLAQVANTDSSRAALLQQIAQADLARGYTVVAPVDGVVTALTARMGQPVTAGQQVMMILPAHSRPSVELDVPTAASGFIREGQVVRLAIDAFPYQSFGTVTGTIRRVATAAVPRAGTNGTVPVYIVSADLPRPWVNAFGRKQPLVPGMTLTARIVTDRRSLLRWLFEPLFAIRNR